MLRTALTPGTAVTTSGAGIHCSLAFAFCANTYGDLGRHPRAIARDPDDAHAYHNRGSAHAALGQFELALTDFDQAIRSDSGLALAFNRPVVRCLEPMFERSFEWRFAMPRKTDRTVGWSDDGTYLSRRYDSSLRQNLQLLR